LKKNNKNFSKINVNTQSVSSNYKMYFVQTLLEKILTFVVLFLVAFFNVADFVGSESIVLTFRIVIILYAIINFIEMVVVIIQFRKGKYITPNLTSAIRRHFSKNK